MPKGENLLGGEVSKATQFASDRQPENRKQPKVNILEAVQELMEGDGWAIVEAELLDEAGKPTGQTSKVRFKTPTVKAAAQAWASKVSKADPRLLEMYLERTFGKVPQNFNMGGQKDNPLNINFENLTTEELKAFLALSEKATNGQSNE